MKFLIDTGIRLAEGEYVYEGRIEVLYKGKWGTVCDDNFDDNDADVACKMMGMIKAKRWQKFRPGSGEIWLDDLGCTGNESNLFDCTHSPFEKHYCSHSEDVWVVCDGKYQNSRKAGPTPNLNLYYQT